MRKIVCIGMLLAGIALAFYPWISNVMYEKEAGSKIKAYERESKKLSEEKYEEILREARVYNQNLAKAEVVLTDPFSEEKVKKYTGREYDAILRLPGSDVMAYVEIPAIHVYLPVYHGTSGEVLEKGIGHLGASSVPVGGKETHAVLTGHTGLNKAKLFTDLEKVKKKDQFYIHAAGKIIAYEVDGIFVVKPEDTSLLRIEKKKDLVTLLTCTPYGVNSHRLLVRGHQVPYEKERYKKEMQKVRKTRWQREYVKAWKEAVMIIICIKGITTIFQKFKLKA